ncbi:helix-turn-helix protein [Herbihabitans rhizosphaerae]|uniref:Helix-turn-helix protein n=1 Tax=Herbihabitans rhizosphaerae TaxID=1872711 RepID=A0A4Q7KGS1_9PSEU|nr:helix-turn-helix transcriptional regulator [Herbihabitans rhizosphaerae]RZS34060.1 helix-turn-helix protein [Herbihabitans rhizosphaerae]
MTEFRPGVRTRRVARELRKWRERIGLQSKEAADRARWSAAKMSKVEHASQPIAGTDVLALGIVYDIPEKERDRLYRAALTAGDRGWWHDYDTDALVPAVQDFVELESEASMLRTFKPDLVPGLLQTEAYLTALVRAMVPKPSEDVIRRRIETRNVRQERVLTERAMRIHAVIWEAALRQNVGGETVMEGQLRRLLDLRERSNITIQVLPLGSGAHPAAGSSFQMLSFVEEHLDDVVYIEDFTQGFYLEEPEQVRGYRLNFDRLRKTALDPAESAELVAQLARDLRR